MGLLDKLKKRYISDVMRNDPRFSCSRQKQEAVLARFRDPADLIERSYFQYRAQMALQGKKALLYEAGALFLLIYKLLSMRENIRPEQSCGLLCVLAGIQEDMVPAELRAQYGSTVFCRYDGRESLDRADRAWFFHRIVKRYPLHFFFQLKILSRLGCYSWLIHTYRPEAVANHCEYSCGSSAMTQYCRDRGVRHINFMHGEKVWYIRDSFFRFDACYVWNEHYSRLFRSLRAAPDQFIVAVPPKFLAAERKSGQTAAGLGRCDFCYYLANESREQVQAVFDRLRELSGHGAACRVRLHPRWGDHAYVRALAEETGIEVEPDGVDVNDSILTAGSAVSLFSTVLLQSHILGTQIVIDDLSSPERFRMLKELDYVALSLPHKLFSEISYP